MRRHVALFFACAVVSATCTLGACGGDDGGGGGEAGTGAVGDSTFTGIYEDILFAHCSTEGCHRGGQGSGKLLLETRDSAYTALIETAAAGPACKDSSLVRVKKGQPDESLLYLKLTNSPPCGVVMPFGGSLDPEDIARIKKWIADGAQDN